MSSAVTVACDAAVDAACDWATVRYEDGDIEDVTRAQAEAMLIGRVRAAAKDRARCAKPVRAGAACRTAPGARAR